MDSSLNEFKFNHIVGDDIYIGGGIKHGGSRTPFLLSNVILLQKCLDMRDCIYIGLVTNANENDYLGGKLLGYSSFGVLLKKTLISCSISCTNLEVGRLIYWPIKNLQDLFIGVMLCVEVPHQFESLNTQIYKNQNNKFLGMKVNLIHKCSLQAGYIARGIISNVLEGDILQFCKLDGNVFGVLILVVYKHCEECDLHEGFTITWHMGLFSNLDNSPSDAILKKK